MNEKFINIDESKILYLESGNSDNNLVLIHGLGASAERWEYVRDSDHINFSWACGGSAIVNPAGRYLMEPNFEKDAILYSDCYANQIKAVKAIFDSLGHYSRWDVAKLLMYNDETNPVIKSSDKPHITITKDDVNRISERFEISKEKLEEIVEELRKILN